MLSLKYKESSYQISGLKKIIMQHLERAVFWSSFSTVFGFGDSFSNGRVGYPEYYRIYLPSMYVCIYVAESIKLCPGGESATKKSYLSYSGK